MGKKKRKRRGHQPRSSEQEHRRWPGSPSNFAWELAELIAGDSPGGFFWGLYYEILEDPEKWGYSADMTTASHNSDDDSALPF